MVRSICCLGAVADDGPGSPPTEHEDELFYHGLIFTIWVGNEYGRGRQYPAHEERGYVLRNVFADGTWKAVLIGDKAFTGIVSHTIEMNDTWELENVAESEDGLLVLCFRSGEEVFYMEEDCERIARLRELEAKRYKNQHPTEGDGVCVPGHLHRRAGYPFDRPAPADPI